MMCTATRVLSTQKMDAIVKLEADHIWSDYR